MNAGLPVAGSRQLRQAAVRLIGADGRGFALVLMLNGLAAAAGLVAPWLLGRIIDDVRSGAGVRAVDRLTLFIVIFAVAQFLLTRYAGYVAFRFGERAAARIREQFVDRVLALPAGIVERAGTGDLTIRGTSDVGSVATSLRGAGPAVLISLVQALIILAAVFALNPILGVFGVAGLGGIAVVSRWYLHRARSAYLAEGAANSRLAEIIASSTTGARTVEALGLQKSRVDAGEMAIEDCRRTRLATLFLRSVLYSVVDVSYLIPVAGILLVGGYLHQHGLISLGTVVSAALYLRQLSQPLDMILLWMEQVQSSSASFARVEGVANRSAQPGLAACPDGDRIEVTDAHFAYDTGGEVLHGISLTVQPGERLAIVGRSGAGKTTLGRLLAGIDRPATGSVNVGGVPVAELSPEQLREHVILVTQEQHVFLGTLRDNLRIAAPDATDAELTQALAVVGADWFADLPEGLDAELGNRPDPAAAQQIALARVVLADPHTVILDEATALLDPNSARRTEQSLAAVLKGRTVIAIAHRLHTAHDAHRVAVMDAGRLTELGTHADLVARGGPYASLWLSWHGESALDPT